MRDWPWPSERSAWGEMPVHDTYGLFGNVLMELQTARHHLG